MKNDGTGCPAVIFWDWNGTLLDDVKVAFHSVNDMLEKRGREPLSMEKYLRYMETPIIRFYAHIFDLNQVSFSVLIQEFQAGYARYIGDARLMEGVCHVLSKARQKGIRQFIVTSAEENSVRSLAERYGILDYFEAIIGAQDTKAESKIERAADAARGLGVEPGQILVIGDTLHDKEMADALGARALLVVRGHQGRKELEASGGEVRDHILEGLEWLKE